MPGESSLAVLDALHDTPEIDTIVCRQEGRVAYMADADGKMTGRPGIAFVTRGPDGFAFAENGRRGNLIGDLVKSGMVGMNTFAISGPDTPFGAGQDLGFGSEGGKEGLGSYQVVKAIHQA